MAKRPYTPPQLNKQDIEDLAPDIQALVQEMIEEIHVSRRREPVSINGSHRQRRRSTRLPIALSIEIDGKKGLPFRAMTVSVNLHGALIKSVKPLDVGSTIYLRLATGAESAARVVYQLPSAALTYGIELSEPTNIWGIAQPPEDWRSIAS